MDRKLHAHLYLVHGFYDGIQMYRISHETLDF